MSRRGQGLHAVTGAAWTGCALCGNTRAEHVLGKDGTSKHAFIGKRAFQRLDPVERLRLSTEYATAENPLPRCQHGKALRDHAGDVLEPPCGCRLAQERS